MPGLNEAIEEFRKKRLAVYQADQQQIVRDSRAAERAARAEAERGMAENIDIGAAEARYSELTGESLHA